MIIAKEELLSAFVDEEASKFEVRRLCRELLYGEAELARWSRYHLLRDTLRGNLPAERIDAGFVVGVMAKIDAEPKLAEPVQGGWSERLLNPAAGFGLAASVAVAAVMVFQSLEVPSAKAPKVARVVSMSSVPQAGSPASVAAADAGGISRRATIRNPEVAARLNSYLVNHSEFAPSRGVMPYARVVAGYEIGQP